MPRKFPDIASAKFRERIQARRTEVEQAVRIRISAIADPREVADPAYLHGLRATVSTGVEYGLAAVEHRGTRLPPIPVVLLAQARMAARNGVSFETVLRRYAAGYALLRDVLIEEADIGKIDRVVLKHMLRRQAALFDQLLSAVSEEYAREAQTPRESRDRRRSELVERLLAGELLDHSELTYSLECWHVGLLAVGPGAPSGVRALAASLNRSLLFIERPEQTLWAWIGGRRPYDAELLEQLPFADWPTGTSLAVGEPAQGLTGWRLTHFQAAATLPIALRARNGVARYAESPLLASALQDDILAVSLRRSYLAPLGAERDGGVTAKATLRAYFAAAGNVTSAAAALGVTRNTVNSRLAAIEERLGRPLDAASAEIETALRLDEIDEPSLGG